MKRTWLALPRQDTGIEGSLGTAGAWDGSRTGSMTYDSPAEARFGGSPLFLQLSRSSLAFVLYPSRCVYIMSHLWQPLIVDCVSALASIHQRSTMSPSSARSMTRALQAARAVPLSHQMFRRARCEIRDSMLCFDVSSVQNEISRCLGVVQT